MGEPVDVGARFDALIGGLDPPMVIVTTAVGDVRAGCLVGFHAQCSIEPRRYAIWLSKANHTVRIALHAEHLAVHFLTEGDRGLATLFGTTSGIDHDKFARCGWTAGPHGVPLLDACPHWVVLRRTGVLDEGSDHFCFAGEPVRVGHTGGFTALRLSDVDDLDPGHEADERPGAAPADLR